MTCYFRHMSEIFDAAGIEVTKENRQDIDRVIHHMVGIEYKDCPSAWRVVKGHIRVDPEVRQSFIDRLAEAVR